MGCDHIAIHHHATTWDIITPPKGLPHHHPLIIMSRHRDGERHGHLYNSTTWAVTTSPRGIARRSHLFLALLGGKLDVAGVVFQNLLAQGCRVDVRVNLCG